jgi:hypothetical protein
MYKLLLFIIVTSTPLYAEENSPDAETWAKYRLNLELQQNSIEREEIIKRYQKIFDFFEERKLKLKKWEQ